jgi:hypothetical protein
MKIADFVKKAQDQYGWLGRDIAVNAGAPRDQEHVDATFLRAWTDAYAVTDGRSIVGGSESHLRSVFGDYVMFPGAIDSDMRFKFSVDKDRYADLRTWEKQVQTVTVTFLGTVLWGCFAYVKRDGELLSYGAESVGVQVDIPSVVFHRLLRLAREEKGDLIVVINDEQTMLRTDAKGFVYVAAI